MPFVKRQPLHSWADIGNIFDRTWPSMSYPFKLSWNAGIEHQTIRLDVFETAEAFIVKASVPGIKAEQLDIKFKDNTLMLHAEDEQQDTENTHYILREHPMTFDRMITLPEGLNVDKAEANYQSGLFIIKIPKFEEIQPKSLKVKVLSDNKHS